MSVQTSTKRQSAETFALVAVSVLLILTSVGNATMLLVASLTAMFGLFVWFLTNRRVWLATVSAAVFLATVIASASKLY